MFKFGDIVKVRCGFYEGLYGMVIDEIKRLHVPTEYTVDGTISTKNYSVVHIQRDFQEGELIKIKEIENG